MCAQIRSGTIPAVKNAQGHWQIDVAEAAKVSPRSNNFAGAGGGDGSLIKDTDLNIARTKREQAQARIKIMEADEMAGELVSTKSVKRQAFKEGRRVREAFMNLPARIAAEVACETDPHKVESFLDTEIREILEGLAILEEDK